MTMSAIQSRMKTLHEEDENDSEENEEDENDSEENDEDETEDKEA